MSVEQIIFTGGGSGGHVVPAINIIKKLQSSQHLKIFYIGSSSGIEKKLIKDLGINYKEISSGKLRRYFSIENVKDFFKVGLGVLEAFFYLLKFDRSTLVFSTGGFVSLPVVLAAFFTFKKIYIHEQTSRVGLANKIASFFAHTIFISFEESRQYFPQKKVHFSGYPLREEIFLCGRNIKKSTKPLLFITGGGNGSELLNKFVLTHLDTLLSQFEVHHQVGAATYSKHLTNEKKDYYVYDFIGDSMIDYIRCADIVISRAGAGMVSELIALGKKSIFVPLKIAQKNEQFFNAVEAQDKLGSTIISEAELAESDSILLDEIFQFEPNLIEGLPISQNGVHKIIRKILT